MALLVKRETVNNFATTLTNAPGTSGVTFDLASVAGLSAGMAAGTTDWFATAVLDSLLDKATETQEIVLVTDVSGNTATVTRQQFGTTALNLQIGDHIIIRPIAYHPNALQDTLIDGLTDIKPKDVQSQGAISATGTITGAASATASVAGVVELATTAETTTGTDATRAVTPDAIADAAHTFNANITIGADILLGAGGVNKIWSKFIKASELEVSATIPPSLANYASGSVIAPVLDFDDTTVESVGITMDLGDDYDGSPLTLTPWWFSAAATSGNIVWGTNLTILTEGDTIVSPASTGGSVTDATNATAGDITKSTISITPAGSGGTLLVGNFFRNASSGSDTLVGDARLLGIALSYT